MSSHLWALAGARAPRPSRGALDQAFHKAEAPAFFGSPSSSFEEERERERKGRGRLVIIQLAKKSGKAEWGWMDDEREK